MIMIPIEACRPQVCFFFFHFRRFSSRCYRSFGLWTIVRGDRFYGSPHWIFGSCALGQDITLSFITWINLHSSLREIERFPLRPWNLGRNLSSGRSFNYFRCILPWTFLGVKGRCSIIPFIRSVWSVRIFSSLPKCSPGRKYSGSFSSHENWLSIVVETFSCIADYFRRCLAVAPEFWPQVVSGTWINLFMHPGLDMAVLELSPIQDFAICFL